MKNPLTKLFAAALLFAVTSSLLCAQDTASTNGSDSNAMTTAQGSQATTNAVATTNSANGKNLDNSVSIGSTGIHVGGGNRSPQVDINWGNGRDRSHMDMVALAAVLSPFMLALVLPLAIIAIVFFSQHRRNKMMHETIRTMVEKGVPVTPELLASLGSRRSPSGDSGPGNPYDQAFQRRHRGRNRRLLPGLILTGIGLALIGVHPRHAGTGGWIVLFIGLAYLIVWLVERNENGNYDGGANMTERKQDNDQQPPKM